MVRIELLSLPVTVFRPYRNNHERRVKSAVYKADSLYL